MACSVSASLRFLDLYQALSLKKAHAHLTHTVGNGRDLISQGRDEIDFFESKERCF